MNLKNEIFCEAIATFKIEARHVRSLIRGGAELQAADGLIVVQEMLRENWVRPVGKPAHNHNHFTHRNEAILL